MMKHFASGLKFEKRPQLGPVGLAAIAPPLFLGLGNVRQTRASIDPERRLWV